MRIPSSQGAECRLDGFFEWMDSPEGGQAIETLGNLLDLMEDVQVDPNQRKLVWPDAGPLNLQHSIAHIQKRYSDFSVEEIEEHLLWWIESGYGPDNCSRSKWMSSKGSPSMGR